MRALITGGAGFIGSTLARALLKNGHDVAVVDNLSTGHRDLVPAGASFTHCDICTPDFHDVIRKAAPEIIFHQAAQTVVQRSVADPVFDAHVNVLGTVNTLHASVIHGVRRVVFASTGGALYGETSIIPTPEDHPAAPASAYGVAKFSAEAYGRLFSAQHGLEFVALRYANVYGPGQDASGESFVLAIFADRLVREQPATINGDGEQTRDYVHVDDVVRANILAAETAVPDAYNIGCGREVSVNDLYTAVARACSSSQPPRHGPAKPGEQRRSCLDCTRARDVLGWAPTVPLEDGIAQTVAYYRERYRATSNR